MNSPSIHGPLAFPRVVFGRGGPLPVGGGNSTRFALARKGCVTATVAAVAWALALAPTATAQDVPAPRPSPLKTDETPVTEESLLATGRAPVAFAEEDFQPVQPSEAFQAATGVDLNQVAQDSGAGGDPGFDTGQAPPIDLAPLADPIDPFAEPDAAGWPNDAPIDLTAPGLGKTDQLGPDDQALLGSYTLEARMTADAPPLESGVIWRVYADDADGAMQMVGEADGGPVTLKLKPGDYYVHVAFGRAGITRRVTISELPRGETVVLNAGGIRLTALAGEDRVLAPEEVRFDIYAPDMGGSDNRVTVLENAPASTVIGLTAGTYHVVCRYGDANAIVRADIRVEPGKLTEATVYQKAARVTLKLVANRGGEALANTAWSVVTPAGESVVESVGAFPSVVLSVGDYTAIATHEGKIFEQNFSIEAGLNRDVEVLVQ